jgi:hypothetical protein
LSQNASPSIWGLPLAEQPVPRHWCGVEGGTVLNNHHLLKILYVLISLMINSLFL